MLRGTDCGLLEDNRGKNRDFGGFRLQFSGGTEAPAPCTSRAELRDRCQYLAVAPTRDIYTHGHQDAVLRSHRWRTAQNSAAYLLGHLRPGEHLLDVGCGPGTLTVGLARAVSPGEVLAIDTSEAVTREAAAHAAETGTTNVSFRTGDFRDLGLEQETFDVVHAHQVLQHLRDPVGAMATMALLVRKGGIVAVRDSDYGGFRWSPASNGLERWREVYSKVARHNGAEPRCRAGAARLGTCRGLDRCDLQLVHLDLRDCERHVVVVATVGRALHHLLFC